MKTILELACESETRQKTKERRTKQKKTKRRKTKENERNDSTNDEIALRINFVKKFSLKRDSKKLKTFLTNVLNIITMFLNMNDENDENNCVLSEDFEITSDDVNKNDDEIRSKRRTTRIASRLFFFFDK